jgi:superfamily II DNA helicase RecQ
LAKSFEFKENSAPISVLTVAPLQSLIEDQIMAMLDIQCTAIQLSPSTVEKILEDPPQFVFATAEQVLEKRFLKTLKDNTSRLHCRVSAVIVDESHTIETWSGKR